MNQEKDETYDTTARKLEVWGRWMVTEGKEYLGWTFFQVAQKDEARGKFARMRSGGPNRRSLASYCRAVDVMKKYEQMSGAETGAEAAEEPRQVTEQARTDDEAGLQPLPCQTLPLVPSGRKKQTTTTSQEWKPWLQAKAWWQRLGPLQQAALAALAVCLLLPNLTTVLIASCSRGLVLLSGALVQIAFSRFTTEVQFMSNRAWASLQSLEAQLALLLEGMLFLETESRHGDMQTTSTSATTTMHMAAGTSCPLPTPPPPCATSSPIWPFLRGVETTLLLLGLYHVRTPRPVAV